MLLFCTGILKGNGIGVDRCGFLQSLVQGRGSKQTSKKDGCVVKRILLTTGGTGGHIFPALAVADTLRTRFPECRIMFVGGTRGPERELATNAGLEFTALPAQGILGKGLRSIPALISMGVGVFKAMGLIRSFKPEVIVGFGGYAGFSPVMAGVLRKVPTAIHEQNSIPGMSNRMLGSRVDRVFVSFPDQTGYFPADRVCLSGNPVRSEIIALGAGEVSRSTHTKNLLILGGSQGATAINEAVMNVLPALCAEHITIWHQTGKKDLQRVRDRYNAICPEARVEAFIQDMAGAYAFADVVLCRAGATTLAELAIAGKPSILIPFPYAAHDHQLKNARYLETSGAALVLVQSYLQEVNLSQVIADLLGMPEKLRAMGCAARKMGKPDSAEIIVDELEELACATRRN